MQEGDQVKLHGFTDGCTIPDGWHTVSKVNENGSFHVGGRTAVWPERIKETAKTPRVGATRND